MKERDSKFQSQLKEARNVIQDLETDKAMAVAQAKQHMHETMESKDTELQQIRASCQAFKQERDDFSVRIQQLEKLGQASYQYCLIFSQAQTMKFILINTSLSMIAYKNIVNIISDYITFGVLFLVQKYLL